MSTQTKNLESLAINTIRTLSIDAVDKANSGHPGLPMGAAPMGYTLWTKQMKHNPANPEWFDRDRFVLSAGHGSMLLYSLLHLSGYELSMEDLKNFRQWGSKTPGHPEYKHTAGVEATTGPLGQGIGMAVGMAMAEAHTAATYNKEGYTLVDHYTYALCGDGDMMEGVSSEAASMAGHLKLGKLVVLYDSNDISLDGKLNLAFSENVRQRYEAYGWQTILVEDGTDTAAINKALETAKADKSRPTLIEVKTVIGYGSPNKSGLVADNAAHGSPLGADETVLTKREYGWPEDKQFYVPDEVSAHFAEVKQKGMDLEQRWNELLQKYKQQYPELGKQFEQAIKGELPQDWDQDLPSYSPDDKAMATRAASGKALNAIAQNLPTLIGGSADLEGSTKTHIDGFAKFDDTDYSGRNVYFGVREFAMGCAVNGMMLHGGVRPYGGTFFVFSDYLRGSIRLASIMKVPVIYVLTHDSIGVGEDGPTHEPVEQLPALRIIPDLTVIRPADGNETSEAWRYAIEQQEGPVALVLTRQGLPILEGSKKAAKEGVRRGAYVLADAPNGKPQVQLLASGSEVQLAVQAQQVLAQEGIGARVISMPSWERFEEQTQEYKDSVILPQVKARLAIEMAYPLGWERYVGDNGDILGISTFGASGKGDVVIENYGFNVDNVVQKVKALLK